VHTTTRGAESNTGMPCTVQAWRVCLIGQQPLSAMSDHAPVHVQDATLRHGDDQQAPVNVVLMHWHDDDISLAKGNPPPCPPATCTTNQCSLRLTALLGIAFRLRRCSVVEWSQVQIDSCVTVAAAHGAVTMGGQNWSEEGLHCSPLDIHVLQGAHELANAGL
jgi:hypothetical protein